MRANFREMEMDILNGRSKLTARKSLEFYTECLRKLMYKFYLGNKENENILSAINIIQLKIEKKCIEKNFSLYGISNSIHEEMMAIFKRW